MACMPAGQTELPARAVVMHFDFGGACRLRLLSGCPDGSWYELFRGWILGFNGSYFELNQSVSRGAFVIEPQLYTFISS